MSAWDVALSNFTNLPSNMMGTAPFILGFTAIEFIQTYARSMLLSGVDETTLRYSLTSNALLGTSDVAKLAYWNNYNVPI